MESATEKIELNDGDLQWISQNYTSLTPFSVPRTTNAWFNCKYLKNDAVIKYMNQCEEKTFEMILENLQTQISDWDHPNIVKVLDYDFNEKDALSYRLVNCQEKGV